MTEEYRQISHFLKRQQGLITGCILQLGKGGRSEKLTNKEDIENFVLQLGAKARTFCQR